jgi:hypothetical protein
MQSYFKEVRVETLRARYAELLRLREYVERLENQGAKSNSDVTENDNRWKNASPIVGLFG